MTLKLSKKKKISTTLQAPTTLKQSNIQQFCSQSPTATFQCSQSTAESLSNFQGIFCFLSPAHYSRVFMFLNRLLSVY